MSDEWELRDIHAVSGKLTTRISKTVSRALALTADGALDLEGGDRSSWDRFNFGV